MSIDEGKKERQKRTNGRWKEKKAQHIQLAVVRTR